MSELTYTYGAKYICIRQADDQPGAQYEPIAQCLSGHYDSPSWERHAACLVEAANSYASSQAEIERLKAALEPFAKAADIKLCGEWRDDERFGQTDVSFHLTFGDLREARAALSGSKE